MRLKVLMLAFEGGGNVPPTLGAAKALARRGHNVRLLCDDCIRQAAEAAGARVTPWRAAPNRRDRSPDSSFVRDWDAPDPQAALAAWLDGMFVGPAFRHARDVVDAASEEPPDVVVGADLLFGGMIAAEVLGRPHALLAPNLALPSLPGHPPLGPGLPPARTDAERAKYREVARFVESLFDRFLPMLNAARSEFGLAPLAHVFDQIAPDRLLLATSRNFDYPLAALPEHVRYIGPILDEPDWAASAPARERPPRTRPYALLAFGTTRQGQDRAI